MAKKQMRKKKVVTEHEHSVSTAQSSVCDTPGDPPHQEIARRAHKLWLDGGCQPNCELQNWREAEEQLRAERESQRI